MLSSVMKYISVWLLATHYTSSLTFLLGPFSLVFSTLPPSHHSHCSGSRWSFLDVTWWRFERLITSVSIILSLFRKWGWCWPVATHSAWVCWDPILPVVPSLLVFSLSVSLSCSSQSPVLVPAYDGGRACVQRMLEGTSFREHKIYERHVRFQLQ